MENGENLPTEKKEWCCGHQSKTKNAHAGVPSGIYGLAFLGAAIYFVQHAQTFWQGVLGILKAMVWPAILIYNLLNFLKL